MNLKIVRRAEWDMEFRAEFWEKKQEGLGREYLLHLHDEFERLLKLAEAGQHSRRYGEFHRFLTKRFSAQVFYEVIDEDVVVEGVFDCREEPAVIGLELSKR
ncbi:MAG: hypothetical protein AAF585_17385 [Verrucomicrobiota bacterium]